MAIPLLAAKMPHAVIAELLQVSMRTVGRWAGEDDVRAGVEAVATRARAAGEERIEGIVARAFDALAESLDSADDRVKLDAAKTALDRFGHPVTTKSEAKHTAEGGAIVLFGRLDEAARIARDGGGE